MPISKGEAWGEPGALPRHGVVVRSDVEALDIVTAAKRAGEPIPPMGLLGGDRNRVNLDDADLISLAAPDELLLIDEAIAKLAGEDARAAQLVRLRYFAGLSVEEAAEMSGLSRSTAYEHWSYARAWLHCELYGH